MKVALIHLALDGTDEGTWGAASALSRINITQDPAIAIPRQMFCDVVKLISPAGDMICCLNISSTFRYNLDKMSSPDDMFSDSPEEMDPEDFTPPSSSVKSSQRSKLSSVKSSQGSKLGSTSSVSKTALLAQTSSWNPESEVTGQKIINSDEKDLNVKETKQTAVKIVVEFFDEAGVKMYSRTSVNKDTINIVTSMLRGSDKDHKKSAVNKLVNSEEFGQDIRKSIVDKLELY